MELSFSILPVSTVSAHMVVRPIGRDPIRLTTTTSVEEE